MSFMLEIYSIYFKLLVAEFVLFSIFTIELYFLFLFSKLIH